jgi:hypothetical protein
MVYNKVKLKSSGDKASPYFGPFWRGKFSDKCLPILILRFIETHFNQPDWFHL